MVPDVMVAIGEPVQPLPLLYRVTVIPVCVPSQTQLFPTRRVQVNVPLGSPPVTLYANGCAKQIAHAVTLANVTSTVAGGVPLQYVQVTHAQLAASLAFLMTSVPSLLMQTPPELVTTPSPAAMLRVAGRRSHRGAYRDPGSHRKHRGQRRGRSAIRRFGTYSPPRSRMKSKIGMDQQVPRVAYSGTAMSFRVDPS